MTRRYRNARLAALEEHRAATQFQPLDPASPTVKIEMRLPAVLRDRVDAAADAAGVSRSEWIRALLEEHS